MSMIDWKDGDQRDTVHLIVQALTEGKVVALPTESSYLLCASGLRTEAADAVAEYASGRSSRLSLIVRGRGEVADYCPEISPVASRIVQRGLPGPIAVGLKADESSLVGALGNKLAGRLREGGLLSVRLPAHPAILDVMRLLKGPVVATEIATEQGVATDAKDAANAAGDACQFVVDDGPTHFGAAATAFSVASNLCKLETPGEVDNERLWQLSQLTVLIVCTGNTCRSPMAQVILDSMLRKKFSLPPQNGPLSGPVFVASAGVSAFPGSPASQGARAAAKARGLSLAAHQSSPVTRHAVEQADFVFAMTGTHRAAILQAMPEAESKVRLISGGAGDVSDPFGGEQAVYDSCADQIEGYLQTWVDTVESSWLPQWQFD